MSVVLDAIDRALGELRPVMAPPTGDLGYGRDLSCTSELSPTLTEVDPMSTRGIAEATLRRLTTPRGMLPGDPSYGLDVRAFCSRGTPEAELRDLAGIVRGEVTKDDRIADVRVSVTRPGMGELRIELRLVPAAPAGTPFSLILAVTSAAVLLEGLT